MRREWGEHSDEVELLKKDSIELSQLISELQTRLSDLKKIEIDEHEKESIEEAIGELSNNLRILQEVNLQIVQFKQIRFSQLVGAEVSLSDPKLLAALRSQGSKGPKTIAESSQLLSPDLLRRIKQQAWRDCGDTIVSQLEKVVASGKLFDAKSEELPAENSIIAQKTGLKMIDFLVKNDFANPESIRGIFQEFDMVESVVQYAYRCFFNDMLDTGWSSSMSLGSHITHSWYWKNLHDSFRVLSDKEESKINFYLVLKRLHAIQQEIFLGGAFILYLRNSFLIDRVRERIGMKQETHINLPINKKADNEMDFYDDFRRILDMLMKYFDDGSDDELQVCAELVTLLKLMDKYLCPGLLKQETQNHPRSQELADALQIITYMNRISDLTHTINSYSQLHTKLIETKSIAAQRRNVLFIDPFLEYLQTIEALLHMLKTRFKEFEARNKMRFGPLEDNLQSLKNEIRRWKIEGYLVPEKILKFVD